MFGKAAFSSSFFFFFKALLLLLKSCFDNDLIPDKIPYIWKNKKQEQQQQETKTKKPHKTKPQHSWTELVFFKKYFPFLSPLGRQQKNGVARFSSALILPLFLIKSDLYFNYLLRGNAISREELHVMYVPVPPAGIQKTYRWIWLCCLLAEQQDWRVEPETAAQGWL